MPSPVTPNSFREVIPDLDGNFCEQFVGSWNAGALFEQWYKSVFNNDGTLTEAYKALICGVGTVAPPVVPNEPPVVPPPTPPTPPPEIVKMPFPTQFFASFGHPRKITVTWSRVPLATRYVLLRDGRSYTTVLATPSSGPTDQYQTFTDNFPGVHPQEQHLYSMIVYGPVGTDNSGQSREVIGVVGSFGV